ncbi:MAG TPA: hypothetical protein ENI07_14795 [Desulfobacterales bacterium]|nr:hypothetical protein [Desulfobacterales bacterium]
MKFYPDVVSVHAPPVLFLIARSFLFFDLSSLSSSFTVDSCTLVVYGNSTGDSTVCIQEGTQADPMTTADFDSFTGSIFDSIVWPPPWEPTYQEITFSLNSTGIAYIQSMLGSTAKICIRNYQYDFLDVEFPDDINAFRAYMAYRENDTELWHPTLNITYEE